MLTSHEIRPLHTLGKGAVGVVFAAYHHGLQRPVAIKCVPNAIVACQPEQLERLRREALAAAQLRSPHAVRILEHRQDGRAAYIVMELLHGMTLHRALKRYRRLAPRHVTAIVSQVGAVLAEAHALNMVHRDIKPSNLFLVRDGNGPFVKVLDFGIAKWLDGAGDALTGTNQILGTPPFMSPEHFRGEVSQMSDLWALSVVAYHALTGRLPFPGRDLVSVALAVLGSEFIPPSIVRRDLGTHVDAWFRRAFAFRAEERFQSASELVSSFQRLWISRDQLPTIVDVDVDWEEPAPASMRYAG
jgi:serine/threonine protein kinase